jgi:hypothetical protein
MVPEAVKGLIFESSSMGSVCPSNVAGTPIVRNKMPAASLFFISTEIIALY